MSAHRAPPGIHYEQTGHMSIAFDLRTILSALFTVYGVVCVIWGVAFDSAADASQRARDPAADH